MRAIIIDDAFIEFRYARNLANGYGIIWNPQEKREEAYSNFLAVLILWPFFYFRFDPIVISKFINILSLLMTAFILYRLSKDEKIDKLVALTVSAIYISMYSSVKHALTGLNTALFVFVLFNFFYIATKSRDRNNSKWYFIFLPLTYLITILARLEGIFFASLFLFLLLYKSKHNRRFFLISCIICYTLGLLYLIWKKFYFGSIFSCPFYVKVKEPWTLPGKIDLIFFIFNYNMLFIFALLGFIFSNRKMNIRYSVFFVLLICFTYLFNSHLMGFEGRFFMPAVPFILFLMAVALDKIISIITQEKYRYIFLISIVLFINLSYFNFKTEIANYFAFRRFIFKGSELLEAWTEKDIQLGKALATLKNISQVKILSEDSGAIGYYSDAKVIDFAGHTHRDIAKIKDKSQRLRYTIFSYSPDLIILRKEKEYETINNYSEQDKKFLLLKDLEQQGKYIFVGRTLDKDNFPTPYYFNFWIKKDSPYFSELFILLNNLIYKKL